jgi:hypothetical protein
MSQKAPYNTHVRHSTKYICIRYTLVFHLFFYFFFLIVPSPIRNRNVTAALHLQTHNSIVLTRCANNVLNRDEFLWHAAVPDTRVPKNNTYYDRPDEKKNEKKEKKENERPADCCGRRLPLRATAFNARVRQQQRHRVSVGGVSGYTHVYACTAVQVYTRVRAIGSPGLRSARCGTA